jgi:hypothetical protein
MNIHRIYNKIMCNCYIEMILIIIGYLLIGSTGTLIAYWLYVNNRLKIDATLKIVGKSLILFIISIIIMFIIIIILQREFELIWNQISY